MREKMELHYNWKFHLGDVPEAFYRGYDDSLWEEVVVPHDWSVKGSFEQTNSSGTGYLPGGIGWYRNHFVLPDNLEGKRVTVTFGGVYNNSQVWCNSHNLGKRPYGYSSFCYEITEFVQPGENVLSVCVRHEDIADSRWFTGSGIYRNVTIEITDAVCFKRHGIFVATKQADNASAELEVQWSADSPQDAQVRFQLLDKTGFMLAESIQSGSNGSCELKIKSPKLWSPDTPNLYCLHAELYHNGILKDCVEISTGIRIFRFDAEKGFFLNGKNEKLKGVCIHHDAGVLGAAVPPSVWKRRFEKLKAMGCNAIRTSHNPPDSLLLDLCDEMGFLVIDEAFDEWEGCKNKWWQGHNVYPPKHFGYSEDFPQWHEIDLAEMVCRDRNHPSIIMWSIGNEIDYPNDPYCSPLFKTMTGNNDANKPAAERQYDPNKPDAKRMRSIAKKLRTIVKKYDTTRPVTAAIAFPELSNQIGYTDVLDIVGYNYKEHLYEEDHVRFPGRILYGSENGHEVEKWASVRDNDYISGQFLWTGIDYMGEAKGWPLRVATPGLLTMAGFEKPKYFHRKALWSTELFATLATRIVTGQDSNVVQQEEIFGWNYNVNDNVEISCYSNAGQVELFLNEESVGIQHANLQQEGKFSWAIPFEGGSLRAVAKRGEDTIETVLQTAKEPCVLELREYALPLTQSENQLIQIELRLLDEDGVMVTQNDIDIKWSVKNAEFLGAESGAPDDLVAYTSNTRKTFRGQMIAYVRMNGLEGEAIICAKGNGYEATIRIEREPMSRIF